MTDRGDSAAAETHWEVLVQSGSQTGTIFPLPGNGGLLGGSERASVRLLDATVAPEHARVERQESGGVFLRSLVRRGLTRLQGDPVEVAPLFDGAQLQLGQVHLLVRERAHRSVLQTGHPEAPLAVDVEPPAKDEETLQPGDELAERYRISELIGSGGMGSVYRAEHLALHKEFAIKVLRRSLGDNADFVRRFEREAVSASQIRHPNIVDVVDFGRTPEGQLYFVMEYLSGRSLQTALDRGESMPLPRALWVARQISRALMAAHERHIFHRDVKPDNVMLLERDGEPDFVKVVDFGIARTNDALKDVRQTQSGTILGTPQYMSPEQASGLEQDARSDIYSLGVILYELLRGEPPFRGPTPTHVLAAHIMQPAPALPERGMYGPIPAELSQLVARMLGKTPQERPQSMLDVSTTLDGLLAELGLHPTSDAPAGTGRNTWPPGTRAPLLRPAAKPRASRWVALAAGAVLVASVGGIVAIVAQQNPPRPRPTPVTARPRTPLLMSVPEVKPPVFVPTSPPATPRHRVQLRISTEPVRAQVFDERGLLGRTPFTLSWEAGKPLRLRFSTPGYFPQTRELTPEEDDALALQLEKRPAKARQGPEDIKDSPY